MSGGEKVFLKNKIQIPRRRSVSNGLVCLEKFEKRSVQERNGVVKFQWCDTLSLPNYATLLLFYIPVLWYMNWFSLEHHVIIRLMHQFR